MRYPNNVKVGDTLIIVGHPDNPDNRLAWHKFVVEEVHSWGARGYVPMQHAWRFGWHTMRGEPHKVFVGIPWDELEERKE